MKAGSYSSNVSTLGSSADVYAVDLVLSVSGTALGDAADHTITLTDCRLTIDVSEGEPNTATVNFECLGTVTFT